MNNHIRITIQYIHINICMYMKINNNTHIHDLLLTHESKYNLQDSYVFGCPNTSQLKH